MAKNQFRHILTVNPGKVIEIDSEQGSVAGGFTASTPVKDQVQQQQLDTSVSEINSTVVPNESDGFSSLYSRGDQIMEEISGGGNDTVVQAETPQLVYQAKLRA